MAVDNAPWAESTGTRRAERIRQIGRGEMHSDAIRFARRDRVSLWVAAIVIAIGLICR